MDEQEDRKKIAIGYDLSDSLSQISYSQMADDAKPSTLAVITGSEKYSIPTVLCKKRDVNQWFFGEEAVRYAKEENLDLIENLLQKAETGVSVQVEEETYQAVKLLGLFLKRSFQMISFIAPWKLVESVVITVEKLDEEVISILNEITRELPVPKEKIYFQSRTESIYYYVINQPEELWKYEVLVLEYGKDKLKSYRLEMNHRTVPVVAYIEERKFEEIRDRKSRLSEMSEKEANESLDGEFLSIVKELTQERIVSSVYLIGDGFEGEWAENTLRYLCSKRRVFQGKNLYTKGACFGAMEKISASPYAKTHVFLGNDKLKSNIGMYAWKEGKETYIPLADAGVNWYDVNSEIEFYLGKEREVKIILTPLTGKNVRTVIIRLTELKDRPNRTSRIWLKLWMKSEDTLMAKISDLGFGEIFVGTGQTWQEAVKLYEE